jgi:hypothetical protein
MNVCPNSYLNEFNQPFSFLQENSIKTCLIPFAGLNETPLFSGRVEKQVKSRVMACKV